MKRKIGYGVAALILAAVAVWGDRPAYACPTTQYIYHYFAEDDPGRTNGMVGEGWTNCETGSYHLCYGVESSNYELETEPCVSCGGGWCS